MAIAPQISLGIFNYARPVGGRSPGRSGAFGSSIPAVTPAPASTTPARQLGGDGVPLDLDGEHNGTHHCLVSPVLWIETLQPLHQPVSVFRRPGPSGDAERELGIAGAEARSPLGTDDPAQWRFVLEDWRLRRRRRPRRRTGPWSAPAGLWSRPMGRSVAAIIALARIGRLDRPFGRQIRPVEAEVGMRVLERLHHLGLERLAANLHVRRRPEQIEHARTLRPLTRSVRVHDVRALVATLVSSVPNEGHDLSLLLIIVGLGFGLRLRCF